STGVGMLAGGALGLAYLVAVEMRHGRREEARARRHDALFAALGSAAGLVLVLALLSLARAPLGATFQAVFVDGPELKGGTRQLLVNLATFIGRNDAVRNTIAGAALLFAVLLSLARTRGSLHMGTARDDDEPLGPKTAALLTLAALAVHGTAIALLAL